MSHAYNAHKKARRNGKRKHGHGQQAHTYRPTFGQKMQKLKKLVDEVLDGNRKEV